MSPERSSVIRDYLSTGHLLSALILILVHGSLSQDIYFPGERPVINQRVGVTTTTTNSPPVQTCPMNMTLSRVANETEDFCDCNAGHLYHPKLDRCFLQYTRGPCEKHEHFILQKNATAAKCVRNPCPKPSTIPYKGSCYELYVPGGPCKSDETLTVPETSYEPECVEITTVTYQIIAVPRKPCGPGTRRASFGKCRQILP